MFPVTDGRRSFSDIDRTPLINGIRITLALLAGGLSLATVPAQGAEPTEDMRSMARMFVLLEARDQQGYCNAMHGPSYESYLDRVCKAAVKHNLKKPEDCSPENIQRERKADYEKCLAMPATEFEQTVVKGRAAREKFEEHARREGVDSQKLMQDARAKKN